MRACGKAVCRRKNTGCDIINDYGYNYIKRYFPRMLSRQIGREARLFCRRAGFSMLNMFASSLQILVFQGVDGIVSFYLAHCIHHGGEYDQKHAHHGDTDSRPRQAEGGFVSLIYRAVHEICDSA